MLQNLENDVKEMLGMLSVSLDRTSNSFGNIRPVTGSSLFDLDLAAGAHIRQLETHRVPRSQSLLVGRIQIPSGTPNQDNDLR
jgi:hypothetical protein